MQKQKRYPGIYSFSENDEKIFFGRDNDIDKILTLIQVEKQILLYSKSGIGKTSLLKAGVIPKLPENYIALDIRFQAYSKNNSVSPLQRIIDALKSKTTDIEKDKNTILDILSSNIDEEKTLWYYFKQAQLASENKNHNYLLVFDQFEELFTYPEHEIDKFKNQLYELTKVKLPTVYKRQIAIKRKENPEIINRNTVANLQNDIQVKTIFAIRSDRLSPLNKLKDKITDIQDIYYELEPLDNEQAKNAIISPASIEDDKFETKKFSFQEEAINQIIKELSANGKQNIETTQLQIVCQRIEDIANELEHDLKVSEESLNVIITDKHLPEFKDIFLNFYNNAVANTVDTRRGVSIQQEIQKFIEDQLIRKGQRISLDENICKDFISTETLKLLVNTHLLRAEQNSIGGFSYELSHDTLIEPILISRKIRIEKEEEAQAQVEREEELRLAKEKAEEERIENEKKRKRQKQIIFIVSIAAVVSIAFGVFGIVNMQIAQQEQARTKQLTITGNLRDANAYVEQEEYEVAYKKYILLRDTILEGNTTPAIEKRIKKCKKLDSISKLFYADLNEIDSLIKSKEIADFQKTGALFKQIEALEYKKGKTKMQNRLKTYNLRIDNIVKNRLRVAESMINAGLSDDAIIYIKEIELLSVDNQQIKDFKEKYDIP